ncbi:MAG: hypothetical protein NC120_11405 [Ruminococcus sp.]|nr:hypothetical protein [Ruminococcus sp.]
MMKNNSALFYTCSLIEFIGRQCRLKRSEVVSLLGDKIIGRIFSHADVLHCEPIAMVANEFISSCDLQSGSFDNEKDCKYETPDYWTIGEVYERLIEDVDDGDIIETLKNVYSSWINDAISNYNSDFFYQPRDYISECYRNGKIIQ